MTPLAFGKASSSQWQVWPGVYRGGQGLEAVSLEHIQGWVSEPVTDPWARESGPLFYAVIPVSAWSSVPSCDPPCIRDVDI